MLITSANCIIVVQFIRLNLFTQTFMRYFILSALLISMLNTGHGQDVIERNYFPGAQARNAAIAAARYAEEGYHYTRFTTFISAIDSSRIYADTALFFVKRSLMLCDTSLFHAPKANKSAIEYLELGKSRTASADSVIREFYPMTDIKSHNYFGKEAAYHLSSAVMDYFSASLLLKPEADNVNVEAYDVLPFDDEIQRLEADETAFQHLANAYDSEVKMLENLSGDINAEIEKTSDQRTRAKLRTWKSEIEQQMSESTSNMEKTAFRIQEIRVLLDKKYLKDLENAESPEHLSQFEVSASKSTSLELDEDLPEGLVYKIQLGYYPSDVDINNFRGLFPISGETVRTGTSRIYAGLFYTYTDASSGLEYVRKNAIANAFIVPFHNGSKIAMSRAVEIEKARGVR